MRLLRYLPANEAISPVDLHKLSVAFDEVCNVLHLEREAAIQEIVAARAFGLARTMTLEYGPRPNPFRNRKAQGFYRASARPVYHPTTDGGRTLDLPLIRLEE